MFEKILNRLQQSDDQEVKMRIKDDDVRILKVLFEQGRQKQYSIEKVTKVPHSTMTGRLEKLQEYRFIMKSQENSFNYYELTPQGLAILVEKGAQEGVTFERALNYFEENQTQYFQTLMRLRPSLLQQLQKRPAWFASQLSPDLWAMYYIQNLSELRIETMKWILGKTKTPWGEMNVNLRLYCSNRLEIEGKGICLKERKVCLYNESNCPLLKKQLEEIAKSI